MLLMFQICFFVGVGLTIAFALLGGLFDFLGVDGLDFDFAGVDVSIPLSPTVYLGFLTVFGGVGWIFEITDNDFAAYVIIILSFLAGVVVAAVIYRLIIVPLKKAQNTSAPDVDELIGLPAQISERIPENGFGEIKYVINGNSYTSPAKSTDGKGILPGKDVSICWIENHVFYVSEINN